MTIFNLGSINIDHVYRVSRLPAPGETAAALSLATGLGGKGSNQSVAAARAGARVCHIGAVGPEGRWTLDHLAEAGVDIASIHIANEPTGHAIIYVDDAAENEIVIFPGANHAPTRCYVEGALSPARSGDTLLLQNETSEQETAAALGHSRGMRVIYSAAPFSVAAVQAVLPQISLLVLNEVEAEQLAAALGHGLASVPVRDIVMTRGARGAVWLSGGREAVSVPALAVTPLDTTGAGDCFIGYLAAALDEGLSPETAMRLAAAAAAIQVTRRGAAPAMPSRAEVEALMATA